MNQAYLLIAMGNLSGGMLIGFIFFLRHRDQRARDTSRIAYRLAFPPNLTIESVTAFTRSLMALRPPSGWLLGRDSVVLECIHRAGQTEHWLWVPRQRADHVLTQLRGLVPGVRTAFVEQSGRPETAWVQELRLTTVAAPLRTDQATSFALSLLHALALASDREELIYQLVAYLLDIPVDLPGRRPGGLAVGPGWLHGLSRTLMRHELNRHFSLVDQRAKLSEPLFGVSVRIGARAATRSRSQQLVGHVAGSVHQLDRPGATLHTRHTPQRWVKRWFGQAATAITRAPVHANARELAVLASWLGASNVPGLQAARGRDFPPAHEIPSEGYVLGQAVYPGLERPVAMSRSDAIMHTLVSGPTGSGKSTLLLNRMKQAADQGEGLILVDPGGDLANDLINCLPARRIHDLIYLNPADRQAVALNPLASSPDDVELVADQMLELIRDRSESWGVQIDETLKATLVLLAASPGMTLTEIPSALLNANFRAHLVSQLDPVFVPTVGEFFARFEARSSAQQAQDAAAVLNKVSPLLDRRPIRAMLGQAEPTWTMRAAIDEGKIVIISLPSGIVGPVAADLIGGMVAQMVWNAALGRANVYQALRRPASLVIDELPRFIRGGTHLPDLLARARAHDLDLTAVVQHLGQVNPRLRAALLSEARNKVIFQPAAEDAGVFARHLLGVRPEDLLGLARRTAVASLVVNGRVTAPVTIATLPPPKPTGCGETARTLSRRRYGRDRQDVERAIQERRRAGNISGPRRTRRTAR